MNQQNKRLWVVAALTSFASWAHAGLVFAVNEGVTYRLPNSEIRGHYAAIAADLSKILKQPVTIEPIDGYGPLRKGLADKAFDLAMVHPAHVAIEAIKRSGYQLVAVTKGYEHYHATFFVKADSPTKSLADLKGRKIAAPDEDSITAWIVRATLPTGCGFSKPASRPQSRMRAWFPPSRTLPAKSDRFDRSTWQIASSGRRSQRL